MKHTRLTLALCAFAGILNAQYTGQSSYNHGGVSVELSSGKHVTIDPGFVMAGYVGTTASGSPNFYVDKVDQDGSFSSSPGIFSQSYLVQTGGFNCTASLSQELNCSGVSIVETQQGPAQYALAAAFDTGVLFATLDNNGNVVNKAYYTFPSSCFLVTQPVITESTFNPGQYYICGSYMDNGNMRLGYAIKVMANSTAMWSRIYFLGTNREIKVNDAVESSYNGTPQLNMIGHVWNDPQGLTTEKGFFMSVDGNNGTSPSMTVYGPNATSYQRFYCISLAASNGGYIVGGMTDDSPSNGYAWVVKLNSNASIKWSHQIKSSVSNTGLIYGIAERNSSSYGYEFHAASYDGLDMTVFKLDNNGNPFSQTGNTNNEFHFTDNGNTTRTAALSYYDIGTDPNNGIHVFGTSVNNGVSRFFLNQACFNGATGNVSSPANQNLTVMSGVTPSHGILTQPTVMDKPGPQQCTNFMVNVNSISYTPSQNILSGSMPSSPYAGNNSRLMQPTGIARVNPDGSQAISVFPNPSNDVVQVNYTVKESSEVSITLTDLMGRYISTIEKGSKANGNHTAAISLQEQGLKSGVYFVNISVNGGSSVQKVVYNRN